MIESETSLMTIFIFFKMIRCFSSTVITMEYKTMTGLSNKSKSDNYIVCWIVLCIENVWKIRKSLYLLYIMPLPRYRTGLMGLQLDAKFYRHVSIDLFKTFFSYLWSNRKMMKPFAIDSCIIPKFVLLFFNDFVTNARKLIRTYNWLW